MKTVKIVVEQHALRCVRVKRRVVLEVDENQSLDPALLRRDIKEGEEDYGPFPWDPVEGSEYLEPGRLGVLGVTDEVADIPNLDMLRKLKPRNSVEKSLGLTPLNMPSRTPDGCLCDGEVWP
jgi:hypothetical protein